MTSEAARLSSNIFNGLHNEDVFCTAWIVTQFKMTVVYDRKAFKTQLTIKEELSLSISALEGRYRNNSSQNGSFHMILIYIRTVTAQSVLMLEMGLFASKICLFFLAKFAGQNVKTLAKLQQNSLTLD